MKKDRINLIIDRALVSMLGRVVEKFTIQDVRGETIDIGYKMSPSKAYIYGRLDRHTNAGLLRLVSERAGGNSRVWTFTEDSDKIRELVLKRLERRRNLRKMRRLEDR